MKTYTAQIVENLIQKVECVYNIISVDMNMSLDDEKTYPESGEDNTYGSNDERTAEVTGDCASRYSRLVVTRWNSVLEMISSLLTLKDEVNEALKRTGNFDLVAKSVDWNILHELCKVLASFKSLTDVASGTFIGLSVIPLIRAKVTAACGQCDPDCADIA